MDRRTQIRDFLTSRRARITPEQAGLKVSPLAGARRVAGLRREEAALLAGVMLKQATVVPAVNQVEVHPYFTQPAVQAADAAHGVLTQAWSPIGGITSYRGTGTSTFDDPVIAAIAAAHGKTPAQAMIRWHLQEGRSAIPKSVRPERIAENFDVFDFELTPAEVKGLDALDTGVRGGPEPDDITLEAYGRPIPEA
jgi:diketogulonate reductase-like aldo/keto reductase